MANDLSGLSAADLLILHGRVSQELRDRGVSRTSNNPTGDLAELLFCRAFGWTQAGNSMKAIDALCTQGLRYQIKGRRITRHNRSRQLGAIRDLAGARFDYLAAVLFDEDYKVLRAAIIPAAVVVAEAKFIEHTNSSKFMLRDAIWAQPGVRDATEELRAVAL
jgi:hypothetical protein